jgi:hypothetical protein
MFSERQETPFYVLFTLKFRLQSVLQKYSLWKNSYRFWNTNQQLWTQYWYYMCSLDIMFGKKYNNNLRNTQKFEMESREVQLTWHCNDQVT